jgi:hypothetical protein
LVFFFSEIGVVSFSGRWVHDINSIAVTRCFLNPDSLDFRIS